jgi:hypothetical protein
MNTIINKMKDAQILKNDIMEKDYTVEWPCIMTQRACLNWLNLDFFREVMKTTYDIFITCFLLIFISSLR